MRFEHILPKKAMMSERAKAFLVQREPVSRVLMLTELL